jgi:hypothetical protein
VSAMWLLVSRIQLTRAAVVEGIIKHRKVTMVGLRLSGRLIFISAILWDQW